MKLKKNRLKNKIKKNIIINNVYEERYNKITPIFSFLLNFIKLIGRVLIDIS
jgi:hypothetical protein